MNDDLPRTAHLRHPRRLPMRGLRPILGAYSRQRYGVTVHGAEHVPLDGPLILAANHLGWLDGPLLGLHGPRRVHTLTKAEMFVGAMGRFLHGTGQIPVDRFAPDPTAIKTSLRVLRAGGVVGIFPEGARGPGELDVFQRGAAYLALATGAPVATVIFFGTREPGADSHSRPSRQSPVDMVFGPPWQRPAIAWPRHKDVVAEATESLRVHMLFALDEAMASTGRTLPGPLPMGDSERAVAAQQAAK